MFCLTCTEQFDVFQLIILVFPTLQLILGFHLTAFVNHFPAQRALKIALYISISQEMADKQIYRFSQVS